VAAEATKRQRSANPILLHTMSNAQHHGRISEVWKHLVLGELLSVKSDFVV